jgi:4-aminobutyrate aminotransferase-like enzyme
MKVLEIIERDGLLESTRALGAHLAARLRTTGSPFVKDVRSIGLMAGVQLSDAFPKGDRAPALEVVVRAMASGLLLIPSGESVVRFLPPLNVSLAEIDEAVDKFIGVLNVLSPNHEK